MLDNGKGTQDASRAAPWRCVGSSKPWTNSHWQGEGQRRPPPGSRGPVAGSLGAHCVESRLQAAGCPRAFARPSPPALGASAPSATRRPRGPRFPSGEGAPGAGEGSLAGSPGPGAWNLGHSGRPPQALARMPGAGRGRLRGASGQRCGVPASGKARSPLPPHPTPRLWRPRSSAGPGEGQQQVTTAGPRGYK